MKERGILFSGEMVRAILDGRKTQTRRAVKLREFQRTRTPGYDFIFRDRRLLWNDYRTADLIAKVCPHGKPGDRLWVREAWRVMASLDNLPGSKFSHTEVMYDADVDGGYGKANVRCGRYRHARFMPRWASRITLEIADVRVQRVQDITDDDAIAEGCAPRRLLNARGEFCALWGRVNGLNSWGENPWVWALTFKRVDARAS